MSDQTPRGTALVESSLTAALVERIRMTLVAAWQTSRFVLMIQRRREQWQMLPAHERRARWGVTLLTAAITAVLLGGLSGTAPGPFWLIVPAIAGCIGALSLAFAVSRPDR